MSVLANECTDIGASSSASISGVSETVAQGSGVPTITTLNPNTSVSPEPSGPTPLPPTRTLASTSTQSLASPIPSATVIFRVGQTAFVDLRNYFVDYAVSFTTTPQVLWVNFLSTLR